MTNQGPPSAFIFAHRDVVMRQSKPHGSKRSKVAYSPENVVKCHSMSQAETYRARR